MKLLSIAVLVISFLAGSLFGSLSRLRSHSLFSLQEKTVSPKAEEPRRSLAAAARTSTPADSPKIEDFLRRSPTSRIFWLQEQKEDELTQSTIHLEAWRRSGDRPEDFEREQESRNKSLRRLLRDRQGLLALYGRTRAPDGTEAEYLVEVQPSTDYPDDFKCLVRSRYQTPGGETSWNLVDNSYCWDFDSSTGMIRFTDYLFSARADSGIPYDQLHFEIPLQQPKGTTALRARNVNEARWEDGSEGVRWNTLNPSDAQTKLSGWREEQRKSWGTIEEAIGASAAASTISTGESAGGSTEEEAW